MAEPVFHSNTAFAVGGGEAAPVGRATPHVVSATVPHPLGERVSSAPGFLLYAMTFVAILLSGLAHLSGSPHYLSVAILIVGIASFLIGWRTRSDAAKVERILDGEAVNRAEIETLADRMWELQESEERFRGLIDALGDIVVHRDRDGHIVYANRVLADLVGCPQKALSGKTLSELGIEIGVVPDAAFAEGECLSSTDVAIRSRGETRWYSWIELSVRDKASDAVSHRAIARDITARKRAEKASVAAREHAEFANLAKSRFLATVSHEIRTPMNGIMGMAKLLADTRLSPEQRTYVGAISTSASALLALIEDLLDFSKIEAGRFDIEPQSVSPREIVENVCELLAAKAYAKGIGLGCYCAPDVPAIITADPNRLRQVLLNLIGNAVKFTEEGGVQVAVEVTGTAASSSIRFTVADTGPGMRKADLDRIFREFEQADGTSTRRHGGAGLGLAISKRIVEAMNGLIGVDSDLGKGSRFHVELPLGRKTVLGVRAKVLEGRNIGILSPNRVEPELIARTVEACGGSAVVADGVAALASETQARDIKLDSILVDTALEKPDGGVLKRLRRIFGGSFEAVTLIAPSDRGHLPEYRQAGYSTFLARPVRGETLLRILLAARSVDPILKTSEKAESTGVSLPETDETALNILIAEDNEINAMLARAALSKAGHRVRLVTNGRAAVDAVIHPEAGTRFDVVLMDLHMPVMDGLDAIALIRKHEEEHGAPPVPIMVLSADGQETTRHAVLAHGATGFVSKPLDPKVLAEAVAEQAVA
ncbi:MAG: ATP-binding protein [Rhizobiaceae bacterium]